MRRRWYRSFVMIAAWLLGCAPLAVSATGTAGFEFLRTPPGARPSAMAGAFISIPGDIHSIYFNPAGLATISGRIASASYLNHVLDFNSGFIGYAQPFKGIGQWGIGINYMNYGNFEQTDELGNRLGDFSAGSLSLQSALGRMVGQNLMIGGSAKVIYSSIDQYSATGVAFDLGLIYQLPFIEDMNVGLGIFNLGSTIDAFLDHKDPMPLNLVIGFSKKLAHLPLVYCVAANKYIDDDIQFNVGGEFTLAEGVFLRLGYSSLGRNMKIGTNDDKFAGLSLGLGVQWKQMAFDYGLSSFGAIGYLNRATFSYQF
ncbi:MAG: PorV/PorQ family protein [candidate division KSB1 bacterium]|nr:PorV/PorQ family protein [candidate division KSB1 bacterium]MDZ7398701.1 PorV/PorQ family protein [candidate division KSB1 bacterium]